MEIITDSHDYEFLSNHNSHTEVVDRYYDNIPQPKDGIIYEDIGIDKNSFTSQFENMVATITINSNLEDERDLCLMFSHLIDWGQQEPPQLDWFENDEEIVEFLGARNGLPYDDHKAGLATDLDKTTYFDEANSTSYIDE